MSVIINASTTYSYDINNVKRLYELKQSSQTEGSAPVTYMCNIASEIDTDGLDIVDIPSMTAARHYYNKMTADLLDGKITKEEYFSHLEDIYYARCNMHYGTDYESIPEDDKSREFNFILGEAMTSFLNYYLVKNLNEQKELCLGDDEVFFYNVEYHYQCEEAKPDFYEGLCSFANKLDLKSNQVDRLLTDPIISVHGRTSIAMTYVTTGANKFIDLDILPPRDFKIALKTQYTPFWAKVWCGGKEYHAEIPFSWQDHIYQVSLSDVLAAFDIPEAYQAFINNVMLVHRTMAWLDPYRPSDIFDFNPKIVAAIKAYDNMMPDAL